MRKLIFLFGLVGMLGSLTGCHRPYCRNCEPCNQCGPGGGGGGLLGSACNGSHYPGCRPGPLSWQAGGTDYAGHLSYRDVKNAPPNPGPPTGTYGYPYYTMRGPRDFLLDNPPSIGR